MGNHCDFKCSKHLRKEVMPRGSVLEDQYESYSFMHKQNWKRIQYNEVLKSILSDQQLSALLNIIKRDEWNIETTCMTQISDDCSLKQGQNDNIICDDPFAASPTEQGTTADTSDISMLPTQADRQSKQEMIAQYEDQ